MSTAGGGRLSAAIDAGGFGQRLLWCDGGGVLVPLGLDF